MDTQIQKLCFSARPQTLHKYEFSWLNASSCSALLSLLKATILLLPCPQLGGCCFDKGSGPNVSYLPEEITVCTSVFGLGWKDFFLQIITFWPAGDLSGP